MPPHYPVSFGNFRTRIQRSLLSLLCISLSTFSFSHVAAADDLDQDQAQKLVITQNGVVDATTDKPVSEWDPRISDPIGDLIAQAKLRRNNMDAAIDSPVSASSELAEAALNYLGVRYRFGGTTPKGGFDCSGLIYYTASKYMGVNLPRVASSMAQVGESVKRDELQPGDLVFFNTRGKRYSHVGIYVGENKFVHSPRTGAVVRVDKMDNVYWNKRYNGARRLEGQRVASR
ncbi:hypothetical protein CAP48_09790 [Advenella sp. S44]|uniref:C40 family peptidase n=1 Tax=Advenella sp. S44 TaxID=1982755 RepID=UPI000C2A49DF|nr:C40 family peptidase [Advenella sp. S44]PJX26278.1 hypothetical protein CAP48_09790 [Advenella sp. S44]